MASLSHPAAEVSIDAAGVRRLLERDDPDLAREPIRLVDEGWDNLTFRVGEDHAVRLPRRASAVALLLKEQRWLPVVARDLPLSVPMPVHAGTPTEEFPWPWSLVTWVPGESAEEHEFNPRDASLMAETLRTLHQAAPREAPVNPFRGVPLPARADAVETRLARYRSRADLGIRRLTAIWREGCSAPAAEATCWLHGDLHPRNVLVRDEALVGLIDWGDLAGGDVATDLACAWLLMEQPAVRRRFFAAYRASDEEVARARGWAVHIGLALVDSAEPRHVPLGLAALARVIADG
jgi:aminoglycoside phosphotransferase (APT) family kinase protein